MSHVSAIKVVQDLIAQGLIKLEVSSNMYEALLEECYPQSPSEYFGLPITINDGPPTVH